MLYLITSDNLSSFQPVFHEPQTQYNNILANNQEIGKKFPGKK